MACWLYRVISRLVGVRELHREVVIEDRQSNLKQHIRRDLTALLTKVNADKRIG